MTKETNPKVYSERVLRIAFWVGFLIGILTTGAALIGVGVVATIGGAL